MVSSMDDQLTLFTDGPDPDCPWCHGKGTVGGCDSSSCESMHMHTYSFCPCTNRRMRLKDGTWVDKPDWSTPA